MKVTATAATVTDSDAATRRNAAKCTPLGGPSSLMSFLSDWDLATITLSGETFMITVIQLYAKQPLLTERTPCRISIMLLIRGPWS